jgi:hypothetical protein
MAGCKNYDYDSLEGINSSGSVLAFHAAYFYVKFPSSSSLRQVVGQASLFVNMPDMWYRASIFLHKVILDVRHRESIFSSVPPQRITSHPSSPLHHSRSPWPKSSGWHPDPFDFAQDKGSAKDLCPRRIHVGSAKPPPHPVMPDSCNRASIFTFLIFVSNSPL